MELGMVGLGRMGGNMVQRLQAGGHRVVAFDQSPQAVRAAEAHGATGAASLDALAEALTPRRVIWLMVPQGAPVDETIAALEPKLEAGDVLVDGGNSHFEDSVRRAARLARRGLHLVDAGTSGGVWGLTVGYCLMVGGAPEAVRAAEPAFRTLAPPDGYLHVGGPGAGHYVKMVHNGIEYGMLQAYAEGFEILTSGRYPIDLGPVAHLWNQGSVVRSWLLELAERAFAADPHLDRIRGYVDDTGEGRWTVEEAIARGVPAPVLALSLMMRQRSRQADSFAAKVVAALRNQFGGHAVQPE